MREMADTAQQDTRVSVEEIPLLPFRTRWQITRIGSTLDHQCWGLDLHSALKPLLQPIVGMVDNFAGEVTRAVRVQCDLGPIRTLEGVTNCLEIFLVDPPTGSQRTAPAPASVH